MRITSLRIERFGVWENLNLPKISRGLNVFFGPNEAGKTTLMQFIRTCLYGGGDEDRARYIQMRGLRCPIRRLCESSSMRQFARRRRVRAICRRVLGSRRALRMRGGAGHRARLRLCRAAGATRRIRGKRSALSSRVWRDCPFAVDYTEPCCLISTRKLRCGN